MCTIDCVRYILLTEYFTVRRLTNMNIKVVCTAHATTVISKAIPQASACNCQTENYTENML